MGEKRYVIGIDGGGTKTDCVIAELGGRFVGFSRTGGSNHQIDGIETAMENVSRAVDEACERAGIRRGEVAFAFLGMAGADLPEDFALLRANLPLAPIPFEIVNDSWIAFFTEAQRDWGAVSICGTGANLGVLKPDGSLLSVRALGYMLGNYGGGQQLAETALHFAFRDSEGTGEPTLLSQRLPEVCGCATMDELALRTYRSDYRYPREFPIPKLVFDLANEGDAVCLRILRQHGEELGEMLGRLITRAGMADQAVPVVLSGSLYTRDTNRRILEPLQTRVSAFVPRAVLLLIRSQPVIGALFRSFSMIGKRLPAEQKQALKEQLAAIPGL